MARTAHKIQGDIRRLLKNSELASQITGSVYRERMRPRDSEKEDAVVIFTTGTTEQIEEGIVTVNLYVPDIDPWGNGVMTEDGERVEELEQLSQDWVDSLRTVSFYDITLRETIHTNFDPEVRQSFIVIKLRYRYLGDGNAEMTEDGE